MISTAYVAPLDCTLRLLNQGKAANGQTFWKKLDCTLRLLNQGKAAVAATMAINEIALFDF